ncbi:MAG: hypothetical protein BIFFINMI_03532 [Phycisphaerae bacterium]|nr:hypothetical protein [Phycisphaerae bacterium]
MGEESDLFQPLLRAEVVKAVERRGPVRIPLVRAKWWGEGLDEQYGDRLAHFDRYPTDVEHLWLPDRFFDAGTWGLPWHKPAGEGVAHDARMYLPSWDLLDEFFARMPDPDQPGLLDSVKERAQAARETDRYLLWGFWRLFFERPWGYRGMENLMVDYYTEPGNIHRLHDGLCDVYCRLIRRAAREMRPDGFWTSDDLGNQRQLMMRPETFREFLLPYYRRVGQACRECGMHFWLHSCGNNEDILGDLADAGVSIFHPVQKHTMDERRTARLFGDRIAFLAGIDVQHVLQECTPDEVRAEVRFLIDTFDAAEGGMCIAAGNGIVAGTPFENIDAFLDEAVRYGARHRSENRCRQQS